MLIRRLVSTVLAMVVVTPLVVGCGRAALPAIRPSSPPAIRPPSPPGKAAAIDRYRLLRLSPQAEVAFTRGTVVWRVVPPDLPRTGPVPLIPFLRFDVATGTTTQDDWLTSLLGGRRIDTWMLAGDAVAWVDTSQRIATDSGAVGTAVGSVLIGARVEVARRSSGSAQPLTRTSWGTASDTSAYSPGAWLDAFNGRFCAFWDLAMGRNGTGLSAHPGPTSGLWVVNVATGGRERINRRGLGWGVLAFGPGSVWLGRNLGAASNAGGRVIGETAPGPGSQTIQVTDVALGGVHTLQASGPAAADRATLAFTAQPPHATDYVDAHVWAYAIGNGKFTQLSSAPGGQHAAAVGNDIVVWIDGRRSTAGQTIEDLYGYDLAGGHEFLIARNPSGHSDPANVTLCGDELFWTMQDASGQTAFGARLVRDGGTVKVEPL